MGGKNTWVENLVLGENYGFLLKVQKKSKSQKTNLTSHLCFFALHEIFSNMICITYMSLM